MRVYVAPNGNDSNNGQSELFPFLTLAKLSATALLNPGDVAAIQGGTWSEGLVVRGNGVAGNSITFTSYGTGRAMLSACDIPTGWVLDGAVAGGDRYKKLALGWTTNTVWRENGVVGNTNVTHLTQAASLAACTALNNWWYTGADLYAVVATGEAPNVGAITIHVGRRDSCVTEFVAGQDYITLDGLYTRFTNDVTGTFSGINCNQNSTSNTGWVLIHGVSEWHPIGIKLDGQGTNSFNEVRVVTCIDYEVRFCHSHGVSFIFLSAGSLVADCNIWGNGRAGLQFAARNSVVNRVTVAWNGNALTKWTNPLAVQGFDPGMYVVGQVPNFDRAFGNLIKYCVAHHNAKAGFQTDALSSLHTFLRCLSYVNTLYAFMLEGGTSNGSYGTKVYHCTAWGNVLSGLQVTNAYGPFDARNCQWYFNGRDATGRQDTNYDFTINTWAVHSGTIYKHEHIDWDPVAVATTAGTLLTHAASLAAMVAGTWWWDAAVTGGTLWVWRTDSGVVATAIADPLVNITLNYNNYTPVGEKLVGSAIYRYLAASFVGTRSGQTIANLQTDMPGKEANGIQLNPSYVDAANANFHLGVGSTARNVAQVIAAVNDGTGDEGKYQGSAPDIGYHEYIPRKRRHTAFAAA